MTESPPNIPGSPVPVEPSTPDPALVTLVMSLLRWVLALLSGAGIIAGASHVSDSTLMAIASAIVGIATAAWGLIAWIKAKRSDHVGNVMSARLQEPVQPKT